MSTNQQVVTGALYTRLVASLQQIAATRRVLDRAGAPIPDDVRQGISDIRRLMLEVGLSVSVIDAIPGLSLPDEDPTVRPVYLSDGHRVVWVDADDPYTDDEIRAALEEQGD
jgi:hypothetical protein